MLTDHYSPDAFGDRFDLANLPLIRHADGYAVQMLDTDTLLDRLTATFLPVRNGALKGIFETFDAAFQAAQQWAIAQQLPPNEHSLAIVPVAYDPVLQRHILIYGVLCTQP